MSNQDTLTGAIGHALQQVDEQMERLRTIKASLETAMSYTGEGQDPSGGQPPGVQPGPELAQDADATEDAQSGRHPL
ncbi:MAG: hypothetical protein OXH56_01925 [Gemmatimonadetes bacterium]|nr:hypothetical protein [Gemmatimonadota bacterium]